MDLATVVGSGPHGRILREDVVAAVQPVALGSTPLTRVQRLVADRMVAVQREVPDFSVRREVDMAAATYLREQFAAAGVTPRIAFEATTPVALADLAERGLGVAIVPASVPRGRDGLHAMSIVPEIRGRLVLAWRSPGPISNGNSWPIQTATRIDSPTAMSW